MAQKEKEINVNQVNYRVYESLIKACLNDYKNAFNQMNPERRVQFILTLHPAKLKSHDILKRQGLSEQEIKKYKNEKIEVRYLRLGKFFERVSFYIPIIEEFKPGFVYQKLNIVNKVWEEVEFKQGDIINQELLDKEQIRVAKISKEKETPIYQQSIRLKTKQEVLNDKWWKRVLYLDLLNTLMAKGIEYGEVLELVRRGEEEKAVLAKELGESAKQVLEANKIVIRKDMPKKLSKEDKAYVEYIKKEKEKLKKKG